MLREVTVLVHEFRERKADGQKQVTFVTEGTHTSGALVNLRPGAKLSGHDCVHSLYTAL